MLKGSMSMDERFIEKCVNDFNKFIEFSEIEKPTLSAKAEVFGKKDCFKLNGLLENQKPVSAPNYNQDQYHIIDLMFELSIKGKLYYKGNDAKGKPALVKTPRLDYYLELNNFEKYVFLLQTYWTKYDFTKKFDKWIPINSFFNFLMYIVDSKPGQEILKNEKHSTQKIYLEAAAFQHHLRFFGMGEPELIIREKWAYEDTIRAFFPTSFGADVAKFLCTEALEFWNMYDLLHLLLPRKKFNKKGDIIRICEMEERRLKERKLEPFEVFKRIFPHDKVVNTVKELSMENVNGVYSFKVSLSKTLWRKIKMSGKHTLGDLHDAIQGAFNFDNDHLYAFYIGGNRRTGKPVYCKEVREGGKAAEETTIQELGLFVGQKLVYLFDFGDCWEFRVELMGIEKEMPLPLTPMIFETKGKSPHQYRYEW